MIYGAGQMGMTTKRVLNEKVSGNPTNQRFLKLQT